MQADICLLNRERRTAQFLLRMNSQVPLRHISMELLHVHSMYSRYDSPQSPDAIVKRAKELGFHSVTLTDHGTMLGIEPFMDAGKKYEMNTVPGVETYCENRTHLILFARNYKGYQLISRAMRDANEHIYKIRGTNLECPIMTDEIIEKYFRGTQDVIATSACIQGPAGYILRQNEKLDREFQKVRKTLEESAEDYQSYVSAEASVNTLTADIREKKAQKKEQEKYLKASYAKKIETLKKKTERKKEKGEDIRSDMFEITSAEEKVQEAPQIIERLEGAIEKEEKMLKEARSDKRKAKNGYTGYKKASEELSTIHYPLRSVLVKKASDRLKWLNEVFPHFFVELQYHGLEAEANIMPLLAEMAGHLNIPVIAANDAHITDGSDDSIEARRILRYNYFKKAENVSSSDRELYIKTESEMRRVLGQILPPETVDKAIKNTEILNRCHVVFPEAKHYPSITKEGMTPEQYFDELLEKARSERIRKGLWSDEYQKRLDHEVQIIKSMGFVDYHLVVRDFCIAGRNLGKIPKDRMQNAPEKYEETLKWIAQEGFDVGAGIGPGRGSACGSLVCNMLGITGIDPIKYDLLFEREENALLKSR